MKSSTNILVKEGLFLALGMIIPYIFHATGIPGTIFLPMHIPVLLCGLILGSKYGLIIGLLTPILNSIFTGMPPMYPVAISMALELGAYGFFSGLLYREKKQNIYVALISSMLLGRVISGIANFLLLTAKGGSFVLAGFLTSSFVTAFWGIIIQLVLIPFLVKALEKTGVVELSR